MGKENKCDRIFAGASPYIFENAKHLRKSMTESEKVLWEVLRNRRLCGLKFRRQHPFNEFIADFYCAEKNLIIEIDGEYHHEKEQKEKDIFRTAIIEKNNTRIIRFLNSEILNNLQSVIKQIEDAIKQ